jgi:hypothetical protein
MMLGIALTPEKEAQVAALDITDKWGGLGYRGFSGYADEITRRVFRDRQRDWARAKQQREEGAIAIWVKALTDEAVLAVIDNFGYPFDSGSYESQVSKMANEACGSRNAAVPKNTTARLEKLVAAGHLHRVKGNEARKRWTSDHTKIGRFIDTQWVYFTKSVAADFDAAQVDGIAAEADRLARVRAAVRAINLALAGSAHGPIAATYEDQPRNRRGSIIVSLEAFEAIAATVAADR